MSVAADTTNSQSIDVEGVGYARSQPSNLRSTLGWHGARALQSIHLMACMLMGVEMLGGEARGDANQWASAAASIDVATPTVQEGEPSR